MDLSFIKTKDVKSPVRGHPSDAGIDFFIPEDFDIIQLSYLFEYCPHQIEDILLNENN